MLEGFFVGWVASVGWVVLLLPIYLVKSAFRMSID